MKCRWTCFISLSTVFSRQDKISSRLIRSNIANYFRDCACRNVAVWGELGLRSKCKREQRNILQNMFVCNVLDCLFYVMLLCLALPHQAHFCFLAQRSTTVCPWSDQVTVSCRILILLDCLPDNSKLCLKRACRRARKYNNNIYVNSNIVPYRTRDCSKM